MGAPSTILNYFFGAVIRILVGHVYGDTDCPYAKDLFESVVHCKVVSQSLQLFAA